MASLPLKADSNFDRTCTPCSVFSDAFDPSPTHFPLRGNTVGGRRGGGGDVGKRARLNVNSRPFPAPAVAGLSSAAVAAATTSTASWNVAIPAWRAAGPATGFPLTSTRKSPTRRTSRAADAGPAFGCNATLAAALAIGAVVAVVAVVAEVADVDVGSHAAGIFKALIAGSLAGSSSSLRPVDLFSPVSSSIPSAVDARVC